MCNSCGSIPNNVDIANACSPYGCQGKFDNVAKGVPSPLPSVP
jgi:hypothetical protein